jgi:hypothetical protein
MLQHCMDNGGKTAPVVMAASGTAEATMTATIDTDSNSSSTHRRSREQQRHHQGAAAVAALDVPQQQHWQVTAAAATAVRQAAGGTLPPSWHRGQHACVVVLIVDALPNSLYCI